MNVLSHFESKGNIELLSQTTLAIFASKNTPSEIFQQAREIFLQLCSLPLSLCGGWQAALEKELLSLTHPQMAADILLYSAKDLAKINLNETLKNLDMFGKLLLLSAESRSDRVSKNDVDKRDDLLFKHMDKVLFMFIESGGRLEKYYNQLVKKNFPVFILDHPLNKNFISPGTVALNKENIIDLGVS